MVRYSKHFLRKLEDLLAETGFILRYEKGNFKSGHCLMKDMKVAVVNKYHSLEGKVNSLAEMLKEIKPDEGALSEKGRKVYRQLQEPQNA